MLSTRNLKAGDVLDGRYRLERRIGGGGMGDVWEATDTVLWRTVAVKVLLADLVDDRGFRERFRREARAIAAMQGPGVVEVYDYGETEDEDAQLAYLIMEYVDGKPLSRLLGLWGKLGAADAMRVVGGVAEALQVAHGAGIVHRDIKPGNILVRGDGSVVLVDFGIAHASHNLTLTTTGVVLGTVTYMSPEQAAGENLTAASDLYSLGVVAHQCLAGSPPFRADTPLGVLSAHLRNAPPPLPAAVPFEVAEIVRRSLQKSPADRWPDAAALAAACRETRETLLARTKVAAAPGAATRVSPAQTPQGAASTLFSPAPVSPVPLSPVPSDPDRADAAPGPRTGAHRRQPSRAVARVGPVTGGHTLPPLTGAHAAPPPPPAAAPEAVEERPRRRGLWLALAGTLAAVAVVGAIAMSLPWHDQNATGTLPETETGADGAQLQGQEGDDNGYWVEDESGGAASPGPSAAASADEATSPVAGQSQSPDASQSPSDSGTPTESATPSQAEQSTVPNVVFHTESDARSRIEESGLNPVVEYEGEGERRCRVVRQHPAAGSEVDSGTTVQVIVRRAADAEACRAESDETTGPSEGP
ncbi:serine/threonine-protein kinase [Glycomyces sp. NRRL B-16210]|uniref:serine/threonine-protein kinase n=1 Tax=Glycomyces sp. NRRL B-16210 TaxID=1463821 RepID=UPI00068FED74|nr:serine/threonine-protein kinase [Glycomyces sp. NRRL B-16210]